MSRLTEAAGRIKRDALTVYFIARNPETPFYVRLLALAIASYAASPIDLIPDVIGFLDDIILLPLGSLLAVKLTPRDIIVESRAEAIRAAEKPVSTAAAVVVVAIWVLSAISLGYWLMNQS